MLLGSAAFSVCMLFDLVDKHNTMIIVPSINTSAGVICMGTILVWTGSFENLATQQRCHFVNLGCHHHCCVGSLSQCNWSIDSSNINSGDCACLFSGIQFPSGLNNHGYPINFSKKCCHDLQYDLGGFLQSDQL